MYNYKLPSYYSYSSLNLYENCPRCWYLKYGLGIREPANFNLEFGGCLHKRIAEYHGGATPSPVPNKYADDDYDESLIKATEPHYKNYIERYSKEADLVEYRDMVELKHPDTHEKLAKPFMVVLDLVKDDYVIDHKTSSGRFSRDKIDNDKQLTLYSYAYRELFNKKEKGVRYNVFVKNKTKSYLEVMDGVRDERKYADLWEWAKKLTDEIESLNFERSIGLAKDRWFSHLSVCVS